MSRSTKQRTVTAIPCPSRAPSTNKFPGTRRVPEARSVTPCFSSQLVDSELPNSSIHGNCTKASRSQNSKSPIRLGAPTTTIVLFHSRADSRSGHPPLPKRIAMSMPSGSSATTSAVGSIIRSISGCAARNPANRGMSHRAANVGVAEIYRGRVSRAPVIVATPSPICSNARPRVCASCSPFAVSLSARPDRSRSATF